ncbi:MAG: ORF6N domain-containing protein [Bacteroidia bacterium]|nr:ORF6N domain-containing protein [Bacteroidia bacterium]
MEENNNQSSNELITAFNINNDQIMFEYDVAEFFNVNTETVLQVVKNNPNRFPDDFLYHLTNREYDALCEQFPNSNLKKTTNIPLGFTEPGMAMLSA